MSGVLTCSIVVGDGWPDVNRADLAERRNAPEARGLISISEESCPQAVGTSTMRAIVSIEADNAASISWYAREVLGLDRHGTSWLDVERQLGAASEGTLTCHRTDAKPRLPGHHRSGH